MSSADPTSAPPTASSPLGFPLLIATMALIISMFALLAVAFKLNDMHGAPAPSANATASGHHATMGQSGSMMGGGPTGVGAVEETNLVVKSDEEHARRGPEGTWHDAFLPADFSVAPGATVKVTVLNYDEGEHSFTSANLGLNVDIPAGTAREPSVTTFTFKAPEKAGDYLWLCAKPCDPWAMSHDGYMRGFVRVT